MINCSDIVAQLLTSDALVGTGGPARVSNSYDFACAISVARRRYLTRPSLADDNYNGTAVQMFIVMERR